MKKQLLLIVALLATAGLSYAINFDYAKYGFNIPADQARGLNVGDTFTITNVDPYAKGSTETLKDASGKIWAKKLRSVFPGGLKGPGRGVETYTVVAIPSGAAASSTSATGRTGVLPAAAVVTGTPKPGLPKGPARPGLSSRPIAEPGLSMPATRPALTGPIELRTAQEEIISAPTPKYAEPAPRIIPGEAEIITVQQPVLPEGQKAAMITPATYPIGYRAPQAGTVEPIRFAGEQVITGPVGQRPAIIKPDVALAQQKLKAAQIAAEAAKVATERAKTRAEQANARAQLEEASKKVKDAATSLREAMNPLAFAIAKSDDPEQVNKVKAALAKANKAEIEAQVDIAWLQTFDRDSVKKARADEIVKLLEDRLEELNK